jgi:hypothetical protein
MPQKKHTKFAPAPHLQEQLFYSGKTEPKKPSQHPLQKYLDRPQVRCTNCGGIFDVDPYSEFADKIRQRTVALGRPTRWKITRYECQTCCNSLFSLPQW